MPPQRNEQTITELGPAARQRAFLKERLVGANEEREQAHQSPSLRAGETFDRVDVAPQTAADVRGATPTDNAPNVAELRQQRLAEFRRRQMVQTTVYPSPKQLPGPLATSRGVEEPDFTETNRWTLLGPTVVREGQSGKQPATSGRIRGIAIAPGGQRIYVAAANGGVWRSEDRGMTWLSLMDAFDLNPSYFRADSLACGAIALAPGNWAGQDMIFVGSGEPGVVPWFQGDSAYFGVGPIVSTDGGLNWVTEPSEPSLAGRAFYALAVDPVWPQRVVAATIEGIYCRESDATGGYRWSRKVEGYFSSVVATHRNNITTFYAAAWQGAIWYSADGAAWEPLESDLRMATPVGQAGAIGRVGLAVQEGNPDVLYALVANQNGHLHGLYRLDRTVASVTSGRPSTAMWQPVRNVPPTLFGPNLQQPGQGGYDLALAVDPDDVNRVYIGGSIVLSDGIEPVQSDGDWSGALYRCEIEVHPTRKTVKAEATYIGGAIHGDLHALCFAPGNGQELWVGCDGGLFFSEEPVADPRAPALQAGLFQPRNTGLATLTMNMLDQHPTEEAVLFCGTQDNGGLRYTGDPVWLYSSGGDSGYFVINWHEPYRVMTTYIYNQILRSVDGGQRYSYEAVHVLPANGSAANFYAPITGTPFEPERPETAELVAFGGDRVWLSHQFGGAGLRWNGAGWSGSVDWRSLPTNRAAEDLLDSTVETMVFASAQKLYAGTANGSVYRFDRGSAATAQGATSAMIAAHTQWERTLLPPLRTDEQMAQPGAITAIAVDPAVADGNAIYVTLGGVDNPARLWYFDGSIWEPRSGQQASAGQDAHQLLNVQHNAIVVDPENPHHLYVAADIGVWRSVDRGESWHVFARGLPDAAVVDLKLYAPGRLLRAATHGRGVYEFDLGRPQRAVDLYLRDHILDLGRRPAIVGVADPTEPGKFVDIGQSPDIKLDVPRIDGTYHFALLTPRHAVSKPPMDFYTFATVLPNSVSVPTHRYWDLHTHVYVQVHNRGQQTANNVRVMLLLATQPQVADAPAGVDQPLPPLPPNLEEFVHQGLPIATDVWQTIGVTTIHGIRAGYPQIAHFLLTGEHLPTPGQLTDDQRFALVAIIHCADDRFMATTPLQISPIANRHIAHKTIQVTPFTGEAPPGTTRRKRPFTPTDDLLAEHKVQSGESLYLIAKHYYHAARLWPLLYQANRQLIGPDPNDLRRGWVLKIPRL